LIIHNEPLLSEFRRKTRCEWCGQNSRTGLDPHHIYTRGAGRLDIRLNLIALCRLCHAEVHAGIVDKYSLVAVVAQREKTDYDTIERLIWHLRRTKGHWRNVINDPKDDI
jgi:hypothetical protein